MIKYEFKVKIDGGAAFQNVATMTKVAPSYEDAEDAIFRDLREKYRDSVAFFNVLSFRRIAG